MWFHRPRMSIHEFHESMQKSVISVSSLGWCCVGASCWRRYSLCGPKTGTRIQLLRQTSEVTPGTLAVLIEPLGLGSIVQRGQWKM